MTLDVRVVAPDPIDATSFYRALGPLAALRKGSSRVTVSTSTDRSWASMALTDVLFLQRPFTNDHLELARSAQEHGTPLWLDYDDDLFAVPPENPAFPLYSSPPIQANLANLVRMADAVSVSTPALKEKLERGGLLRRGRRPCVVVPNAFNDLVLAGRAAPPGARAEQVVLWRGSGSHRADVEAFRDPLIGAVRRRGPWRWHFWGHEPAFLRGELRGQVTHSPGTDVIHYHHALLDLRPAVVVVPLVDCEFNRAKSNVAWLEALFAGAVTLAPDWEEWRRPGCFHYRDADDFEDALARLLSGEVDLARERARGWEYVQERLRLTQVNQLRLDLLEELAGR